MMFSRWMRDLQERGLSSARTAWFAVCEAKGWETTGENRRRSVAAGAL
jgi:hypothetical protein